MALLIVLALVLTIATLLYFYLTRNLYFWERRGIPSLTASTLSGAFKGTFIGYPREFYTYLPDEPYIGITTLSDPIMSVRDPDLIKLILIKDFSYFQDRGAVFNEKWDPLAAHLFFLDGRRWKLLRAKLSPTFSTGRMKAMFPLMQQSTDHLVSILSSKHADTNEAVDLWDLVSRSIVDTILCCAFGLQGNSLKDPDDIYLKLVKKNFQKNTYLRTMRNLFNAFPWLAYIVPPEKDRREINDFFIKTFSSTIKHRKETGIKRNDLVDLLLEIKTKGYLEGGKIDADAMDTSIEFTDSLMASQAWVFFVAGSESSSSTISFTIIELANHRDILERLQKDVDDAVAKHGGLTFESLADMQYLEMVISETLRLYPVAPTIKRRVTEKYTMPDGVVIPKGVRVAIDVMGLHQDPKYFPDPKKFDPERFTPEAKLERNKYVYMPFGEGPRFCIGARFAQVKLREVLASIVYNFDIKPKPGIPYPPTLSNRSAFISLEHGAPVILTKRRPT